MSKEISPNQTIAEQKAIAIINSCSTINHFDSARKYLDLFHRNFNDTLASVKLWTLWKNKVANIKTN